MKLDLNANPQAFAQQMQAEARRIAKGIRRGVAASTAEVKEELRSQIRSGSFRGERVLANAWRSRVYPERDNGTWKPAGSPAFDAGSGVPNLVATMPQALSAGYREATDAALKFRDAGVISVAAFSDLLNAVNQARQVGGAENEVLREYEEGLIRLLPRVRGYETAMRQLNTAQQALADNNGPQAQIERMRGVVSEVGGRYQSRAQIRDRRADINAGLQSGVATTEDTIAASPGGGTDEKGQLAAL